MRFLSFCLEPFQRLSKSSCSIKKELRMRTDPLESLVSRNATLSTQYPAKAQTADSRVIPLRNYTESCTPPRGSCRPTIPNFIKSCAEFTRIACRTFNVPRNQCFSDTLNATVPIKMSGRRNAFTDLYSDTISRIILVQAIVDR